jgi:uncharacterized protein YbjT (DUF2867 family)
MAKHHNETILVTGATGHQGGAALRHLRDAGFSVRCLTRNPDNPNARRLAGPRTEIVRGDLGEESSLRRALDGVQGAFSVQDSTKGYETEVQQGLNMAKEANRAGVNHFVYNSVASADRTTGIPHFDSKYEIETHIRNIGLRYTIFRPVFFMENLLQLKPSVEQGSFKMPLSPQTRLQMIAVDDIGAFVSMAFDRTGHWVHRVMELAGDELSMEEIASAFGRRTGSTVRYEQVPWDVFEQQAGKEITRMFRWFESDGYHVDIMAVRQERPNLQTFDKWLNLNWLQAERRASGGGGGL